MLVGLYGGTFDPVHLGHIHAALAAHEVLGLPQVRMVLAARPGHRSAPAGSALHRWRMLCLACEAHPVLVPDDSELRREGHSYTIDTVIAARGVEQRCVPCWILGQDAFATLPSWHQWQRLLDYCNLIVVHRPNDTRPEPAPVQALCRVHAVDRLDPNRVGQIARLDVPMRALSSTMVRAQVAAGEMPSDLLAAPVSAYIKAHGLYANTEQVV